MFFSSGICWVWDWNCQRIGYSPGHRSGLTWFDGIAHEDGNRSYRQLHEGTKGIVNRQRQTGQEAVAGPSNETHVQSNRRSEWVNNGPDRIYLAIYVNIVINKPNEAFCVPVTDLITKKKMILADQFILESIWLRELLASLVHLFSPFHRSSHWITRYCPFAPYAFRYFKT
jgi:hypothetical protein